MDLDEMLRVDRCRSMDELINAWARDPDYSPDAGTGLLSPISYKRCNAECYVGKIPRTRIGGVVFGASRGFKMVLFTELSDNLCRRCMRSTNCPSNFISIQL